MEVTFFVCRSDDAVGVAHADDLPVDPAAEPLRMPGLETLRSLLVQLGGVEAARLEPLRDATCQSFPVFELAAAAPLGALAPDSVEPVAAAWRDQADWRGEPPDLDVLCELLDDLRVAVAAAGGDEKLFVLLEEKAL